MSKYFTSEEGKWETIEGGKALIEFSESYLSERELEEQQIQEQELINSLIPSEKQLLMAEIELSTIILLLEMEVI